MEKCKSCSPRYYSIYDPERVCIVGSSYGGYAALAGGAFTPDVYKCVVAVNGVSDLDRFRSYKVKQTGSKSSGSVEYWKLQFGGDNYTKEKASLKSPAKHADNFKVPVLLIYSTDDEVVPPVQSRTMERALKKAKKVVTAIELEGDDHYMSQGDTRLEALKAIVDFVNKYLREK